MGPAGQLGGFEHAGTNGIVDVVVDVGDAIDEADDVPLEGRRLDARHECAAMPSRTPESG